MCAGASQQGVQHEGDGTTQAAKLCSTDNLFPVLDVPKYEGRSQHGNNPTFCAGKPLCCQKEG